MGSWIDYSEQLRKAIAEFQAECANRALKAGETATPGVSQFIANDGSMYRAKIDAIEAAAERDAQEACDWFGVTREVCGR